MTMIEGKWKRIVSSWARREPRPMSEQEQSIRAELLAMHNMRIDNRLISDVEIIKKNKEAKNA